MKKENNKRFILFRHNDKNYIADTFFRSGRDEVFCFDFKECHFIVLKDRKAASFVYEDKAQNPEYLDAVELNRIMSAARFSMSCHNGQSDKSGKPYFHHPATVAETVEGESKR